MSAAPTFDALTLAVIQAGLQQVCNEMDVAFTRSAFSPVISEADDRSDGIYDPVDGSLIAQGEFGLLRSWSDVLVMLAVFGLPQGLLHLQYREGVPVFTGPRSPLEPNASTPGRPLTVSGTIVLGGNLAAGDYVLQIAFRDLEAPAKQQYALRTADFVLEATPPPVAPAP